jgi:hypothetical protein
MKKLLIAIIAIIALAALWYFVSPLFINKTVEEDLPDEFVQMMPSDEGRSTSEVAEPAGEVVAPRMGSFIDVDAIHKGSGSAILLEGESSSIVRFEDFEVTNGPDLFVLLAKGERITKSSELGDYINLGRLKGNKGAQNYEIPEDIDPSEYDSVIIYCRAFSVVFSSADLN